MTFRLPAARMFWPVFLLVQVALSSEDSIEQLTSSIFAPYNSICYLMDPLGDLSRLWKHIKRPIYLQPYQQLNANGQANATLHCDCFLMDRADLSPVISHLESRRNNYLVRPYTTLWLILPWLGQLQLPEMFRPYALNVLVLQHSSTELLIYSASRREMLFNSSTGQSLDWSLFKPARWQAKDLFEFRKSQLRISFFNCKPFMYQEGVARGVEIKWINELIWNLPKAWMPVPSSENPWKYSITKVQARECDLAGCSQYALNLMKWNVDSILSHVQACYTFLVPKGRHLPEVSFLVQAFAWQVWLAFLLSLACLVLLGAKMGVWSTMALSAINVLKVFSAGAAHLSPTAPRAFKRLFLISLLVYGLLFDAYYTAGSSSILTKPRIVRIINTFKDMVQFKVGYQLQSRSIQSNFRSLNSSTFNALAELYRHGDRRKTSLDGRSALIVKNIGNTYVTDLGEFQHEQLRHYRVIKECISNNYIGLAVMKNSPLTRVFNGVSQRLTESGLILKWLRDEIYSERESQQEYFKVYESGSDYGMITSGKLAGALVVLLLGYGAAALSFALELHFYHMSH